MGNNDTPGRPPDRHPFLRLAGSIFGGQAGDALPIIFAERRRLALPGLVLWALVIAVVIAGGIWMACGMRSLATVESASAGVMIVRGDGQIPAVENLRMRPDDLVQIPPDGRAAFSYRDGARVASESMSELIFEPLLILPIAGAPRSTKNISVPMGLVRIAVTQQQPGQSLTVFTPHAQARTSEARFTVSATPTVSRIEVESGSVLVTSRHDGKATIVNAGKSLEVTEQ